MQDTSPGPVNYSVPPGAYPATFSVDYPEGRRNRLTTFFRLFTVIPIVIVLSILGGVDFSWDVSTWGQASNTGEGWRFATSATGSLFFATLLMILFRRKYPRWWFDWTLNLYRFSSRVASYFILLRDEYPSTDEEQAVHVNLVYPDASKDLNRWLPLVKWFLAIPHFVVLFFLSIAALVCTVIAWFAILFGAGYPKEMFQFVVGVQRWALRVAAYAFLLTTDRYPPFSLT